MLRRIATQKKYREEYFFSLQQLDRRTTRRDGHDNPDVYLADEQETTAGARPSPFSARKSSSSKSYPEVNTDFDFFSKESVQMQHEIQIPKTLHFHEASSFLNLQADEFVQRTKNAMKNYSPTVEVPSTGELSSSEETTTEKKSAVAQHNNMGEERGRRGAEDQIEDTTSSTFMTAKSRVDVKKSIWNTQPEDPPEVEDQIVAILGCLRAAESTPREKLKAFVYSQRLLEQFFANVSGVVDHAASSSSQHRQLPGSGASEENTAREQVSCQGPSSPAATSVDTREPGGVKTMGPQSPSSAAQSDLQEGQPPNGSGEQKNNKHHPPAAAEQSRKPTERPEDVTLQNRAEFEQVLKILQEILEQDRALRSAGSSQTSARLESNYLAGNLLKNGESGGVLNMQTESETEVEPSNQQHSPMGGDIKAAGQEQQQEDESATAGRGEGASSTFSSVVRKSYKLLSKDRKHLEQIVKLLQENYFPTRRFSAENLNLKIKLKLHDLEEKKILIVLKSGGQLTEHGEQQATLLGKKMRTESYKGEDIHVLQTQYRHQFDLKITDDGCQLSTAAVFTKSLLNVCGSIAQTAVAYVRSIGMGPSSSAPADRQGGRILGAPMSSSSSSAATSAVAVASKNVTERRTSSAGSEILGDLLRGGSSTTTAAVEDSAAMRTRKTASTGGDISSYVGGGGAAASSITGASILKSCRARLYEVMNSTETDVERVAQVFALNVVNGTNTSKVPSGDVVTGALPDRPLPEGSTSSPSSSSTVLVAPVNEELKETIRDLMKEFGSMRGALLRVAELLQQVLVTAKEDGLLLDAATSVASTAAASPRTMEEQNLIKRWVTMAEKLQRLKTTSNMQKNDSFNTVSHAKEKVNMQECGPHRDSTAAGGSAPLVDDPPGRSPPRGPREAGKQPVIEASATGTGGTTATSSGPPSNPTSYSRSSTVLNETVALFPTLHWMLEYDYGKNPGLLEKLLRGKNQATELQRLVRSKLAKILIPQEFGLTRSEKVVIAAQLLKPYLEEFLKKLDSFFVSRRNRTGSTLSTASTSVSTTTSSTAAHLGAVVAEQAPLQWTSATAGTSTTRRTRTTGSDYIDHDSTDIPRSDGPPGFHLDKAGNKIYNKERTSSLLSSKMSLSPLPEHRRLVEVAAALSTEEEDETLKEETRAEVVVAAGAAAAQFSDEDPSNSATEVEDDGADVDLIPAEVVTCGSGLTSANIREESSPTSAHDKISNTQSNGDGKDSNVSPEVQLVEAASSNEAMSKAWPLRSSSTRQTPLKFAAARTSSENAEESKNATYYNFPPVVEVEVPSTDRSVENLASASTAPATVEAGIMQSHDPATGAPPAVKKQPPEPRMQKRLNLLKHGPPALYEVDALKMQSDRLEQYSNSKLLSSYNQQMTGMSGSFSSATASSNMHDPAGAPLSLVNNRQTSLYFTRKSVLLSWLHLFLHLEEPNLLGGIADVKTRKFVESHLHCLGPLAYVLIKITQSGKVLVEFSPGFDFEFPQHSDGSSTSRAGDFHLFSSATTASVGQAVVGSTDEGCIFVDEGRRDSPTSSTATSSHKLVLLNSTLPHFVAWLRRACKLSTMSI
ncbi:unnamed protein product [Amoebophrya sp. A120]|nr:unnamed protein product [Amoebophrya sp. A120]|eukprot:GSA120T00005963001.1